MILQINSILKSIWNWINLDIYFKILMFNDIHCSFSSTTVMAPQNGSNTAQVIASIIIWFVMSNFNFKWVQDVLCGGFGVLKKVHYNIIIIGTLRQKKRSKTLIIYMSKLNHYDNKFMIYQLKRMYLEWKHSKNANIQYRLLFIEYIQCEA